MTSFNLKLTDTELRLLTVLAADQLFRREFIDSRMPGYRPDNAEMLLGKKLVERLRTVADGGYAAKVRLRKLIGASGETAPGGYTK